MEFFNSNNYRINTMKDAIKDIIGKTIKGVVVKKSDTRNPRSQVFLVFTDDTYYELYAESTIIGAGGLDPGGMEKVRNYGSENKIIFDYSVE